MAASMAWALHEAGPTVQLNGGAEDEGRGPEDSRTGVLYPPARHPTSPGTVEAAGLGEEECGLAPPVACIAFFEHSSPGET
jgi:hypothetical protein